MKKVLIPILLLLFVIPLLGLWFLFFSTTGLRISLDVAGRVIPGNIDAAGVSGRLADHFILEDLRYIDDEAVISMDRVSFSWRPASLLQKTVFIRSLDIGAMDVVVKETSVPEDEPDGETGGPDFSLPFAVRINRAAIASLAISLPGQEQLAFDTITLEDVTGDQNRIEFGHLGIAAPLYAVGLRGEVQTGESLFVRLSVDYALRPEGYGVFEGSGNVTGSPAEINVSADLQYPFPAQLQGTVIDPAGEPRWQAVLQSDAASLAAISGDWPRFSFSGFRANGHGTFAVYSLQVETDVEYEDFRKIHVSTGIDGDAGSLRFADTLLRRGQGELAGQGGIAWEEAFTWQAELTGKQIVLSGIHSDWPELTLPELVLNGQGEDDRYLLKVQAGVQYDEISGTIQVESAVEGDGAGLQLTDTILSLGEGRLTGEAGLAWEETFSWRAQMTGNQINLSGINAAWPEIFLPELVLSGAGEQDSYTLDLQADAQYKTNQNIVHAESSIQGDQNGLQLIDTVLGMGEGRLTGEARLDWQEDFRWAAEWSGKNLDPAVIESRLAGSLDLHFLTEGSLTDRGMQGNVHLDSLAGELRGQKITAQGKAAVDGSDYTLDDFSLNMPGTEITAAGHIGEEMDLDFAAVSSDLSVLWPEFGGMVKADGSIGGLRSRPEVCLDFAGENISAYGSELGRLDGKISTDFTAAGKVAAAVSASQLMVAERTVDTLRIDLHGTVAEHTLQIDASGDDADISLALQGGLADEIWKAEIRQAAMNAGKFGTWQLQEPGALELSRTDLVLRGFCLAGMEDALVCLAGSQGPAGWQAGTEVTSLPLTYLQKALGQDQLAPFAGTLSGNLSAAGIRDDIQSGELMLATDQASIMLTLPDEETYELVWLENYLQAEFADRTLTGQIKSILRNGSVAEASLRIDDFSPASPKPEDMKLQGTVTLNIPDLNFLSVLTFPHVEPYGSLAGNIALDGTAAKPLLNGEVKLQEGEMIVPQLGITLEDLSLRLDGHDRPLTFHVAGSSGGGRIEAEGELVSGNGRDDSILVTISGDNFEAVRLPELVLNVSPQLEMELSGRQGSAHGSLHITDGIISPAGFSGSVSPSRDVVLRNGDEDVGDKGWPFSAVLSIIVDPKVQVNAFGLRGRVGGAMQVADLPGKIVTGTGNLDVIEGTFAVYGRELQIKRGQLLYSGGPIDNPGVSVRAENTSARGVTTGIEVSGFLRQPEITFYSDPPMEESEIISRLLMDTTLVGSSDKDSGFIDSVTAGTGLDPLTSTLSDVKETLRVEDIRVETGKTSEDLSLVIGTWLTPSLYVGYGKNLLKESGSFYTRYILGRGFSVETESGATESGVDLKYEIE
ncbi:MAG: translocation/assembly module TamB domain-containing protein [Desulfobulbaceae bacterium]|nr:translocation/assembly module TamB domain-containing protein [Desulfobulbaceae bacterium]